MSCPFGPSASRSASRQRAKLGFALPQERTDQTLKGLRQGGIRDVALVLVELARGKQAARRHQHLVQLVHDGRLADPGIAGDQHQLRRAALDDAVEGGEQDLDLARPSVQLLGDQQPVGRIAFAEREVVDASFGLELREAAPKIALAGRPPSGSAPRPSSRAAS